MSFLCGFFYLFLNPLAKKLMFFGVELRIVMVLKQNDCKYFKYNLLFSILRFIKLYS